MPPVGSESTLSAGERPKTYALDGAATGTGTQISYFMKIRPAGAKSFGVDGRTDRTKLIVFFFSRNFANAPVNRNLRFAQYLYVSLLEPKMKLDYFLMFSNELLAYALH